MPSFSLIALGLLLLLFAFLSWRQPRAAFAIAQWSHAVWELDEEADLFYERLFQLLEARLTAHPLPFDSLSVGPRSLLATRTLLGGQALYLEARYNHLTYYVYANPMPGGLFVSTWLFSKMAGWEERPLLKWLLAWRVTGLTLFGSDCLEMFHLTVHGAVIDLLDDYARERHLPPLDEVARRPILHGFYAKRKGTGPGASVAGSAPPSRLPFETKREDNSLPASGPPTTRPKIPRPTNRPQGTS